MLTFGLCLIEGPAVDRNDALAAGDTAMAHEVGCNHTCSSPVALREGRAVDRSDELAASDAALADEAGCNDMHLSPSALV